MLGLKNSEVFYLLVRSRQIACKEAIKLALNDLQLVITKSWGLLARSIESQKRPCSNAIFCLTFHVIEGLNARDQIALYVFQSFLVEV